MTIYPKPFLDECRASADEKADLFIKRQFETLVKKTSLKSNLDQLTKNAEVANFINKYPESSWLANFSTLPEWADRKKMKLGSDFFVRYAEPVMNLLGLLSLPYCYAAADGARVLSLSGQIKKNPGNRFSETASFVWDVMAPGAFDQNGKGFSGILKVRLIHASIRFYILQSKSWNSDWGVPVNQEDMAGTNLSFSLIAIRGLRKMGFAISYKQQEAFIHLWNVIGYLLGLKRELLPQNGLEANSLERSIRKRQFKYSEHGSQLTDQLVNFMCANSNGKISKNYLLELMRYLIGDEISELINIKPFKNQNLNPFPIKVFTGLQQLMRSAKSYRAQQNKFQKQTQAVKNPFGLPIGLKQ
jgi:hypothetical protein